MTISDGIETTRAMVDSDNRAVNVSPNGKRYVLMLIRGDVAADGVWAEVLSGRVAPGQQARPDLVARFFTRGLGPGFGFTLYGATNLTQPGANMPVWLDDDRVAFLWEDARGTIQVVSVDIDRRETTYLTRSNTDVLGFAISPRGALVYESIVSQSKARSEELLRDGFAVDSADPLPMMAGYVDGTSMFDFMNCERFIVPQAGASAKRLPLASPVHGGYTLLLFRGAASNPVFSPDGRHLILEGPVTAVPPDWSKYTDDTLKSWLAERAENPKSLGARQLRRLVIVDVQTGASRPLWNAPFDVSKGLRFVWSPDSRSVLIWPAFLPPSEPGAAGLAGTALADVNISNGRSSSVPIERNSVSRIQAVRFSMPDVAEITLDDGRRLRYRKLEDSWRPAGAGSSASPRIHGGLGLRIELRQDMNTSPTLEAVDGRTGEHEQVLDLNPSLKSRALGKVTIIHWQDERHGEWVGRLYHPIRYSKGSRYPLVIQSRCYADETEFSLYGCAGKDTYPASGPGWSSFIAQSLAAQDIFVLQVSAIPRRRLAVEAEESQVPIPPEWRYQRSAEAGWRAAAEYLIDAGLVKADAIGLMGFSATGWMVEYVLAHSKFRYAAAIASDHGNQNYLHAALSGWPAGAANAAGGAPFGEGLKAWLANAPAFNVERIHTPLQLQVTSSSEGFGNLLWHWEMYSRLRYLHKPVEYYVAPDIRHGSHILQNPKQLMALQNRALDWWCFWLKNEERGGAEKVEQYTSWRKLRRQNAGER